jgi:outer membrane protein OmpA-like peptidoglycan-associated protein
MKKIIIFFLFLLICELLNAQSVNFIKTLKAVSSLKTAQKFINLSDFETAKIHLEKTIKIKDDFGVAYRELGKVHLLLAEYDDAINAYEKSFDLDPKLSRAAYYECGEAYFRTSRFDVAATYFKQYESMKNTRYTNSRREEELEEKYDGEAQQRKDNYEFAMEAIKYPVSDNPLNLGGKINSTFDEYLPSMSASGNALVFTSKRTYSTVDMPTGENIFIIKKQESLWLDPLSISPMINSPVNEGMAKLAADERYMFFAACQREDSKGGCDIYRAVLDNFRVDQVRPLEGELNSEAWDSQPAITCDGKTLYFSSSREGGYGGADIYVSFLRPDGSWSEAQNLGASINTKGDEEAPYIAPDGNTMFFASTGLLGMGDGDIFVTVREKIGNDYQWTKPKNLGYPINSTFQEVGFVLKPDGYSAFFASSRLNGFGSLDIYEVEIPEQYQPARTVLLEGRVTDDLTGAPLEVDLEIIRNDDKWNVKSDENGYYFLCLSAKQAYSFSTVVPNYEYFSEAVFLAEQDNSIPFRFDIALKPNNVPIRKDDDSAPSRISMNIYFDFDDFALNDQARTQLDKLIEKLKFDPEWEVEVIGYTDNVGSTAYNQILSEKRAQSVVTHLRDASIEVNKVRQEGRGSTTSSSVDAMRGSSKDRRVEVVLRKI